MAVEIIQFLMSKFVDGLGEEDNATIPFILQFHEIKEDLKKKTRFSMSLGTADLLRESLYDLNDILIECQMLSKKHRNHEQRKRTCFYSLTDLCFLFKTRKRLLRIKRKIRTISDGRIKGKSSSGPLRGDMGRRGPVEFDRWTSQAVDKAKVHGATNQLIEVERMLTGEDKNGFKGIGIVGMGGVGKTLLAQLLFNSQQVRRRFFPRLWVCVSQTIHRGKDLRREILERMLTSLGVEEDVITSISNSDSRSNSLAELMFTLHLQLMGKRYLIVFDDVWNIDEWYENLDSELPGDDQWDDRLAFGLPKGSGGGAIITSRVEEVAVKMVGEENLYHLQPLTDRESCWAIFMDALTKDGRMSDHPTVRGMKKEILDNCSGLPLAAKTVGEILNGSLSSSGDSSRKTSLSDDSSKGSGSV
ncbi:probable disease resistance protein At5g45490 [Phoenix dactylifera]|uniref:Probable disease resistance protein At5g45490 n=1 Tax=Phoenix dactylifera TaxID=42345 RepID=A0A8B7D506_PHODC|nr:probable disease resistance protein At5g45490 [Phoenix dactylifera]